ncbi:DNA mismatch repair endonuclease MutL [Buchnera aphidicola]|uniref:DNA mismatch repair endonuclease MutL n=1 Tax=Buchnera aphidicola TaxID=9 RepID=UPI000A9E65BB|nr:DNA mismatch repair endonuclease MutL [Buchnera aphidicola]
MPFIRVLPLDLSSQISSGEVIDCLAGVVQEIIETSIDENAKNIDIRIEKNGFQSILIQDDGFGINKKELLLALTRHATSKINSLSDLNSIHTFEFRDEALASICSISKCNLISSNKNNNIAWKIYSEGSIDTNKIVLQPIAYPQGTTVIIENFFYNIPVKLKFIKNERLEFLKIFNIIKRIALSNFDINFSFKHNKKIIIQYYNTKNKTSNLHRLKDVFLNKIDIKNLLEIKFKLHNMILSGWILNSGDLNNFKKIQYRYVNNRYVCNKTIINAVYYTSNKILGNNKISFILYLNMPSNEIDINIHPTKNEIAFHQCNVVYSFIYLAIFCTLKNNQNKFLSNKIFDSLIQKHIIKKTKTQRNLIFDDCLKQCNYSLHNLLIVVRNYYGLMHHRGNFSLISFLLSQAIVKKYQLRINIINNIELKYFITHITIHLTSTNYLTLLFHEKILLKFGFRLILKKIVLF